MASPHPAPAGRPVPLRTAVAGATFLTRRMRRLVLAGGDLDHLVWSGPASHCKLILPAPGRGPEALPAVGVLQPVRLDRAMTTLRTYTPRAWDAAGSELTIDVLLHGDGAASDWAAEARPGAPLAVTSPLGRYDVEAGAGWLVLAGDETALPAIATILEVTPASVPTTVLAEVEGPADRLDLGAGPTVDVRWLTRTGRPGSVLLSALQRSLPGGDGQVWVACEAHAMLGIRRYLLDDRSLPRRSVTTRGYWTSGRTEDGPRSPGGPDPIAADEPDEPQAATSRWLR